MVLRLERAWRNVEWPVACEGADAADGIHDERIYTNFYIRTTDPIVRAHASALELFEGPILFDVADQQWAESRESRGGIKQTTCRCGSAWPFYFTGACCGCREVA